MESLEKSSLYNQPERLEQLLSDLYKDSPRIEFLPVRKFFNFYFAFFLFLRYIGLLRISKSSWNNNINI